MGTYTELPATYWTLQDLGDPLLLLHHVEVLPQVGRHVPAAEVLRVTLVHTVEVALLGVVAGQGQGERPRRLPHLHQTHVVTVLLVLWNLCEGEGMKHHRSVRIQAVKATGLLIFYQERYCMGAMVTHVITGMETKARRNIVG